MSINSDQMSKYHKKQRGFSLFEMLLTVGVAATFFIFLFNIGQTIARNQAVNTASSYVEDLEDAVGLVLSDPGRFNALYNNVLAGGGIAQASISNLKQGTGVLNFLGTNELLNSAFPDTGPFRQTYRVIFRIPSAIGSQRALETFVASETSLDGDLAFRIAGAIDGTGGLLRENIFAPGSTSLSSAYGTWNVPTSNLAATGWFANVNASIPPANNEAYVVAYNYYDLGRIARDYLYRTDEGDPTLNTMFTDLSLGSYNLLGVDNISGSGGLTANELIVEGTSNFANAPVINGLLQSDGPLAVGAISASGNNLQMAANNGDVVVNNGITSNRAIVNNTLTTDNLNAQSLTAENVSLSGNAFSVDVSGGINASASSTGVTVSNGLNVAGQLQSESFAAGSNLVINGGDLGVIGLDASGDVSQNPGARTTTDVFGGAGLTSSDSANWPCGTGC